MSLAYLTHLFTMKRGADGNINSLNLPYTWSYELPFERNFNASTVTHLYEDNWVYTIHLSLIYGAVVFGISHLMKNKKPFELRRPLILWNAALCVFSFLGALRLSEEALHQYKTQPFWMTCCYSGPPNSVLGFWSHMFALSKVVELGDTFFIVLRKKPLLFLHYYHHISVLIYTWQSGAEHCAAGRWFILMNYTVHSLMYGYFTLRAMGFRVPLIGSIIVTFMQTMQMVLGLIICSTALRKKWEGIPCQMTDFNIALCLTIYATYFLLFSKFFADAYVWPKGGKKKGVKKTQ